MPPSSGPSSPIINIYILIYFSIGHHNKPRSGSDNCESPASSHVQLEQVSKRFLKKSKKKDILKVKILQMTCI